MERNRDRGCATRLRYVARLAVTLPAVLSGASADAGGADAAVARGETLAREVCSACHLVSADQAPRNLPAEAPAFREIANRPGTTEQSLRKFLATTHWDMKSLPPTMPSPMLGPEQIRDVARYLLTLRTPTGSGG